MCPNSLVMHLTWERFMGGALAEAPKWCFAIWARRKAKRFPRSYWNGEERYFLCWNKWHLDEKVLIKYWRGKVVELMFETDK